ncbi:MAG: hypothetical protein ABIP75_04885, partial [Pyrinomonadaceae bacterium]
MKNHLGASPEILNLADITNLAGIDPRQTNQSAVYDAAQINSRRRKRRLSRPSAKNNNPVTAHRRALPRTIPGITKLRDANPSRQLGLLGDMDLFFLVNPAGQKQHAKNTCHHGASNGQNQGRLRAFSTLSSKKDRDLPDRKSGRAQAQQHKQYVFTLHPEPPA